MYCSKCGKQIDYDAPICKECETQQNLNENILPVENKETPYNTAVATSTVGNRMEGFKGALASAILGLSSLVFRFVSLLLIMQRSIVYLIFAIFSQADVLGELTQRFIIFDLISIAVTLAMSIPSLIFGIKGIICFHRAKTEGRIKPIATLVCSIVGTVTAIICISIVFKTSLSDIQMLISP